MILHERWFVDRPNIPIDSTLAGSAAHTWIPLAIALGVTATAVVVWRAVRHRRIVRRTMELGVEPSVYDELIAWTPVVIGLHTAVLLIVSGISRQLFVPNMPLPANLFGAALGLAQIAIALSFFYGGLTRIFSVLLAAIWLIGAFLFGPVLLLEHVFLLGIAWFVYASGRGPLSVDMIMRGTHLEARPVDARAVTVLRILTGASLAVLAFTEKLWNVPLAAAFLENHDFNFLPALGFDVSTETFVLMAGTVELTLGVLLMSGAFLRLVIVLLWLPFNLTLPLLGWRELVGHLPIYGIMALLLVYGDQYSRKEVAS
jgi:hypothetical protein